MAAAQRCPPSAPTRCLAVSLPPASARPDLAVADLLVTASCDEFNAASPRTAGVESVDAASPRAAGVELVECWRCPGQQKRARSDRAHVGCSGAVKKRVGAGR